MRATFSSRPAAGDASLSDPRRGRPQKLELTVPAWLFKKGTNEIRLTCTEGSWVQYDAITLLSDADARLPRPGIQSVTARPTPLFIRRDGQLRRIIEVTVTPTASAEGLLLRVDSAGEKSEISIPQPSAFGATTHDIDVPDWPAPQDMTIRAVLAGDTKTTRLRVLPGRKWRVVRGRQLPHGHRLHAPAADVRRAAQPERRDGRRSDPPLS